MRPKKFHRTDSNQWDGQLQGFVPVAHLPTITTYLAVAAPPTTGQHLNSEQAQQGLFRSVLWQTNFQIFQKIPFRWRSPQTKIQKIRPTIVKTTSTGPQRRVVQFLPNPQLCHKNSSWNQLTRFCLAVPHVIVWRNQDRTPQHSEKTKKRMQFDPSHWNGFRMLIQKRVLLETDPSIFRLLSSHKRKSTAYMKMPVPVVKRL